MKTLFYFALIVLVIISCRKEEVILSKSCKDCSNKILKNDSIFNSIAIDSTLNEYEIISVEIIDNCLVPRIRIVACELTCDEYKFYAKKNLADNYYEINYNILNEEFCTALTGGELMPINISSLQDTSKNEILLKLYNYDEIISYKY